MDDPCRIINGKTSNSVFRTGVEYCVQVTDPSHKNGVEWYYLIINQAQSFLCKNYVK